MKIIAKLLLIINFFVIAHPRVRLKDITTMKGEFVKKVIGYGIVTGLEGTGDGNKSIFTIQSIANMLSNYGISINQNAIRPKNVAAVMVTANIPNSYKKGMRLDVTVSSIGDAKSLQGGNLLLTPLTDPLISGKSKVYAEASGPISIGGFNLGGGGNNLRKNHSLVGKIPAGALLKINIENNFLAADSTVSLLISNPDYTTASRIAYSINESIGENLAVALSNSQVAIKVPPNYLKTGKAVRFISLLENIKIIPSDIAKVVVNERTGTIVIGERVKLNTVAISHGNLSIKIETNTKIIQPNPFAEGQTAKEINSTSKVEEEPARVILTNEAATLKNLVKGLNKLGVTPRDMISILQALKRAGALHAQIELI